MGTSFGALCTDFYINQKLALKMDLPGERETILHLFDRVRKSEPSMAKFRRYDDELALESSRRESEYKWLALRRTSVRTGHVNPESMDRAYGYHKMILEVAPYHLTISPLDVDYLELLFGFDLECKGNHDAVIYEALIADSPLGRLLSTPDADDDDSRGYDQLIDVQPVFGIKLDKQGDYQAYFEVKSRQRNRKGHSGRYSDEPISLFLTVRYYGEIEHVDQLPDILDSLKGHAEALATERLVPDMLTPIARAIPSGSA